ncbi:MAG: hypothetical protein J7521_20930 [Caulobacter sp.]|nr:hypothetical protein [Caulobacter sp.]
MSISLVLTTAGLAAIVNARNTGTNSVEIAQLGLTQTAFAPTAGTTVIPDEFGRLSTFSGDVVADDTIHLVVKDEGVDEYSLRGLGLYLAGGVLFATYSQATPIVQKTASSIVLLAVDIKLAAGDAATINFGNTDFLNPPATVDRQGVIALASLGQVLAGMDPNTAVTPATLKPIVDALLKLAGGQTVAGNVGFGGAPPLRPVTVQGDLAVRNPAASANYRNWSFLASGPTKGSLTLRQLYDAGDAVTQTFLTVDGNSRAVDFAVQPTVAGQGIWHAGNLVPDVNPTADAVAKRNGSGHLRATWFNPEVGAGLFNAAGYYFYSGGAGGSAWCLRSAHATDSLLVLARADGQQVGALQAGSDYVGLLNKLGAWRLRTGPSGAGEIFNDAGAAYSIWTSNNFDPSSKASAVHSHDWAQVTGKPATYPPSAHGHVWGDLSGVPATFPPSGHTHDWSQVTGRPGTFPPDPHGHDLAGLASSVQSIAANGYMRIGSLMLVWGEIGFIAGDTAGSCVFPTAFPNYCAGVTAVPTVNSGINSGASRYGWSIYRRDQFGFDMINDSAASGYLYLAWGW